MTQTPLDIIKELAREFPVPGEQKLERRLGHLRRMTSWYDTRIEDLSGPQRSMFQNYVATLLYSETILKRYDEMTKKIKDMAEAE